MEDKKINISDLFTFCNKYSLFTSGSIAQYDKFLMIAKNGVTPKGLFNMLYLCSNVDSVRLADLVSEFIQTQK